MTSLNEKKISVLNLLCENLKQPQPAVVGIDAIAAHLNMSLKETRQLLLRMDQSGEIQIGVDGSHSLITQAGVSWMTEMGCGGMSASA